MRQRSIAAFALVTPLVAALAGLAWLSRYPEAPLVARAESWPLVGPFAARFRAAHLPHAGAAAPNPRRLRLSKKLFDDEEGFPLAAAPPTPERIWIGPGEALRATPSEGGLRVTRFDHHASLKVVDRRPGWVKVEYRDHSGWVPLQGEWREPPLGSAPDPTLPLPAQRPDPARLALARAALGDDAVAGRLGPYPLYTDLVDPERLAWLDGLAADFEDAYRRRYGLTAVGEPAETVVLFTREAAYRRFLDQHERIAGLPASGHAAYGLVALYDGGRSAGEVGTTLAHELGHLLNRRAIGPALPSWLDEGIADELAQSRIGPSGRLEPGALGGATVRTGQRVEMHGAHASLYQLVEAMHGGRLRPLPELLDLDWSEFVTPPRGRLHYAQSAFWVRYLLDGEEGALAPGFRRYLSAIAGGGPVTPEALRGHLARSWEELEAGYRAWIVARQAEAAATVATAAN
jgi:hypothetical protein